MQMEEIMVSILCLAYNHENSVAQALDGMLMQKADFSYEILIHDDASTDRTAQIIREYEKKYPTIIRAVYQEKNQYYNCNLIKEYLRPIARGKYIAICETDDYWTDPNKLSKQVSFLEDNPDYTMCFHAVEQVDSTGNKKIIHPVNKSGTVPAELIIERGAMFCPPPSLFRREILDEWPMFRDMERAFDYPTQVLAAYRGKVYYMDEVMAAYRFESTGSWTKAHDEEPDWDHWESKKKWMAAFDEYTGEKYHQAILSHMAWYCMSQHMHFLREDTAKVALESIRQLSRAEYLKYRGILAALQLGGKPAVKVAKNFKELLKRWGLY